MAFGHLSPPLLRHVYNRQDRITALSLWYAPLQISLVVITTASFTLLLFFWALWQSSASTTMLRKGWALFAVFYTVLPWLVVSAEMVWDSYSGQTNPSNYIFYDPSDECDTSSEPCITSFKYCSHAAEDPENRLRHDYRCPADAKTHNSSWIDRGETGNVRWIEIRREPRALYSAYTLYTLKWQNNNPDYPTTVTFRGEQGLGSFYMYKGKQLVLVQNGETQKKD